MKTAVGAATLLLLAGCTRHGTGNVPGRIFTEITAESGLDASPPRWPDGRYQIPEISAGGVALFDFDGDGDIDIYQVRHPAPDAPDSPAPNRLYRRETNGAYAEAPRTGLEDPGYGNGVAVGDVNNDGLPDVYVANLGADRLLVSSGGGIFRDATAESGIHESGWSTCAAFLDHDRDGDLDLYVAHYLIDDPSRICRTGTGAARDYCGPTRFQPALDSLFRNEGDGRFTDAGLAAGITQARPGFGVIACDFTLDGWPDVFVANDLQPNQLHVNQRNGTFTDEAVLRGVAVNGAGNAQSGMGVAAGDMNGDGILDLLVTNLKDQPNSLFLSSPGGDAGPHWRDQSATSGLGAPSLPWTGWGCALLDLDHDGDLDAAIVNGRVARDTVLAGASLGPFWDAYGEHNSIYLQAATGKLVPAGMGDEAFTQRVEVTHSLALGDLDGDGDIDAVTSDAGDRLRIYRNDGPAPGTHWLRVRALAHRRDALGARVTVEAGGKRQTRPLIAAYSFAASSEAVAHFGLGAARKVEGIEVEWPDGPPERFDGVEADRTLVLEQSKGKAAR